MRPKNRVQEKSYDIVVVGGGLSGMCAAIAAARHGAKVAIVHARPVFGGNCSSEMRMHIHGASCRDGKKDVMETGILMEILLENKNRNPYQVYSIWDVVMWEKMRYQENLDIYLNTAMHDLEASGDTIKKVTCFQETTEMTYVFSANIFIDATGNGTVGYFAGAEFRIGSEGKNEFGEPNAPEQANRHVMGNTLLFQAEDKCTPVPFQKPFWAYEFTEEDLYLRRHGNTNVNYGKDGITESYNVDSGYWWNEISGREEDIIAEHEEIRDELYKSTFGIWDHIKNKGDHGAANYDLKWVGAVPGMRESRRMVGDYLLNENDVWNQTVFSDAVAYGGWPMDEHSPFGLFREDPMIPPSRMINFEGVYTIPYRCFYSKNISNLMYAGRDISASRMAFGSTRVMGTCAIGGQAAGTAAAIALKYGCTPREVSGHMTELQQTLLKDDCYIPGFKNEDPSDLARTATILASSFLPGCEPNNVINGVARRVGSDENCWESSGLSSSGEKLTLALNVGVSLKQVRITFDPNLSREIMPSITRNVLKEQVIGLPIELVKDYSLSIWDGDKKVFEKQVRNNYQRLNIHDVPSDMFGDKVVITVERTHGYENARIFEVRIYAHR